MKLNFMSTRFLRILVAAGYKRIFGTCRGQTDIFRWPCFSQWYEEADITCLETG